MSDWEPFDDELAGRLRRRAGAVSNDPLATESAHRAVLARASGVRRRRAAVVGSGSLVVVMVGGLLALTTGGGSDDALAPGTDPVLPASSVPSPTSSLTPSTTPTTTPTTGWPGSTVTLTVPPVSDPGSTTSSSPSSSTSSSTAPADTTPPGTYAYPTAGGTLEVAWDGDALALLSAEPAQGYTVEIEHQERDRVEVRFRGAGDYRIDCRIVNGQIEVDYT